MTPWPPEEDDDGEDLPDEQEVPGADPEDGFDDVPETHFSDADYERFVAENLDGEGRPKGDPPVTAILLGLTAAILLVYLLFFR